MNIDRELLVNEIIERLLNDAHRTVWTMSGLTATEARFVWMKYIAALLHSEVTERQIEVQRELLPEKPK